MVHVMVVVVMMMDVVMMMVVMHRRLGHRSGRRRASGFLRDGISGEAERENGRGRKGLDHGRTFLWLANPNGSARLIETAA